MEPKMHAMFTKGGMKKVSADARVAYGMTEGGNT